METENSDAGLTRVKMSRKVFYVWIFFPRLGEPRLASTAHVSGNLNTFIIGILGSLAFSA